MNVDEEDDTKYHFWTKPRRGFAIYKMCVRYVMLHDVNWRDFMENVGEDKSDTQRSLSRESLDNELLNYGNGLKWIWGDLQLLFSWKQP